MSTTFVNWKNVYYFCSSFAFVITGDVFRNSGGSDVFTLKSSATALKICAISAPASNLFYLIGSTTRKDLPLPSALTQLLLKQRVRF